jgi:hypothetical protein
MATLANPDWVGRELWGFRGQRDASWGLMPSAFREGTILGFQAKTHAPPPAKPMDRKDEERRAIVNFLFLADRVGIAVPGDGQHIRVPKLPGHPQRVDLAYWPWQEVLDTLAIAQHHGVPTRLIDFSHNPLVAAFFACYDAWKHFGRPSIEDGIADKGLVGIFAINIRNIMVHVTHRSQSSKSPRLIIISAPRASNSFLHHQDGFFLLDLDTDARGYPPLERAYEDVLEELRQAKRTIYEDPPLKKLMLPYSQVPQMLALLADEFVNIARIQPTPDNVVQALRDNQTLFKGTDRHR